MNSGDSLRSAPIDGRILDIFDELTESEKRLAEVVLESQGNLSAFTAGELASRAGVSNATAARFFQRLGYRTYGEARRAARNAEAWGSPLYELAGAQSRAQSGSLALHIAQDLRNLSRTAETLSAPLLDQAIEILIRARTVWTLGFRNSYALASYARGLLLHAKPDVRMLPLAGSSIGEELVGIGPEHAFFVMGFRRRPAVLREILAVTAASGAKSVLVCDFTAAGTAQVATVTLRCHNRGASQLDSYAAPMSVINYICSAVGLGMGQAGIVRLNEIEQLHKRLDPFAAPRSGKPRKT